MPLQTYEVTLEPLGKFFFGGEVTFGQKGNTGRRESYLVKSRYLPQQTSLLGVLRYALLREAELLAPYDEEKDREAAEKLVGAAGFTLEPDILGQGENPYGAIKKMGPLALRDLNAGNQSPWAPFPIDVGKAPNGKAFAWHRAPAGYWELQHYNPKKELSSRFATLGQAPVATEDLFAAQAQAGNRISNRLYRSPDGTEAGESDEGFFRQTFRVNNRNRRFAFVFRVLLEEDELGAAAGAVGAKKRKVCLGGERSLFHLSLARVGSPVNSADDANLAALLPTVSQGEPLPNNSDYRRLLLLSDTYLPKQLLTDQDFVVAHPKPFRFLSSSLAKDAVTDNFVRRKEHDRYTLLERGGVILTPNDRADDLRDAIQNIKPFFQIGYNYCRYV